MKVIDHLDSFWLDSESVLTIGVFDGVHRGHQTLIHRVVERARSTGRESGVVTFFPHPANVLSPENPVQYLTTPGERAAILERLGVDFMALIQFTPAFAELSAKQFVDLLREHLRPAEIWVGRNFSFGRGGQGNVSFLQEQGRQMGFGVHVLDPIRWNGDIVSSSRVRKLLADGKMEEVADLLGRYYMIAGEVVQGRQRGHQLGFPTANLEVRRERALPRDGVYACFALLGAQRFPAVANLGIRPTFGDRDRLLEVYLLDVDIDLYGCDLVVEFVRWMRPELKFKSPEGLIAQMKQDVEEARQLLRGIGRTQYDLAFSNWSFLRRGST